MNCTIVIEQQLGDKVRQHIYQFDDYRVATALSNILCNLTDVKHDFNEYTKG